MQDDKGKKVTNFEGLSSMGVNHFKSIFAAQQGTSIAYIVKIVGLFPHFVDQDGNETLRKEVSALKLLATLQSFQKDTSLGPDGWPVEFYLGFYDFIGGDLLKVVEESHKEGYIHPPLNSSFIALIPKKGCLRKFKDFRTISLCNYIYKIISKVIAKRLKDALSAHIQKEQFGFLEGKQIHEAIRVPQEGLHNIKSKHMQGAMLKIDLSKAYDRVNWLYVRLLLTHLGFQIDFIRWIMSCITTISFAILINGATSPFFHTERGLRQGCPLSPFLFLLIVEGLSRFIKKAKADGYFKGIQISPGLAITHLLFVDDILISYNVSHRGLQSFSQGMDLFIRATGIAINDEKLTVNRANLSEEAIRTLGTFFQFQSWDLDMGVKYLGFFLKPNDYMRKDWFWL